MSSRIPSRNVSQLHPTVGMSGGQGDIDFTPHFTIQDDGRDLFSVRDDFIINISKSNFQLIRWFLNVLRLIFPKQVCREPVLM